MSYREIQMIDVKEVLRHWQAGHSCRKIGHDTGVDRKTVARYVGAAHELALPKDRPLSEGEIHEVAQRIQARMLPEASAEWQEVAKHHDKIKTWLDGRQPLKLTKIHILLKREEMTASYQTLRRYAIEELGWGKKQPTILLEDAEPGQEAQVDFGQMGFVVDPETHRKVKLYALIITLVFSRHMFVWPTFRQTTEAVCEGLDRAWRFFGGMARVLIPDNTKAMVVDPDALAPKLTDAFLDYIQTRGIFVDPARIRSPKDKARVENQVPYVRENWFQGETFPTLADARASAESWCRETAGGRLHGTTKKVPREVYESMEHQAMLPAPTEPFDVPHWGKATVHPDHHIQVLAALYSLPTRFIGKEVRVRVDKATVRVYLGAELIKMHPRKERGGRSTDTDDYPAGKAMYALRSVESIIAKARKHGVHVGIYAERLLAGPLPWSRMRQAYALLRLCDKYGDGRVEAVCQSALAFDVIDVHRVKKMVAAPKKQANQLADSSRKVVQLPLPRFARVVEHFETTKVTQKTDGTKGDA
jgi:transposase